MAKKGSDKPRPRLTEQEKSKIETLAAVGYGSHVIGRAVGRAPATVAAHLKKPEAAGNVDETRAELAEMFRDLARRAVVSITDDDLKKLNALQRATVAGIAVDKLRLLEGETANLNVLSLQVIIEKATDMTRRRLAGAQVVEIEAEESPSPGPPEGE